MVPTPTQNLRELLGAREFGTFDVQWTSKDALLYALGVGAGSVDPLSELELTTENSEGVAQVVLPTFPVVLEPDVNLAVGDIDPASLVHAEQRLELYHPVPVAGSARLVTSVTGVHDKGSGALVELETTSFDLGTGSLLWRSVSSTFVRGAGGFDADAPSNAGVWTRPERGADTSLSFRTHPEQALLYRLNGDRNPLHSDPAFARRAGFDRPILHGLCTFGISARLVRNAYADWGALRLVSGRFTRPVFTGDELTVNMWVVSDGELVFQTQDSHGAIVLDRGIAGFGARAERGGTGV